ncbi:MAG: ABC transporter permease, partial [Acetivibrionales bacterium]
DMLRACIVPCMFCIGAYIVIVSGGIDLSFPAIASLSSYVVIVSQIKSGLGGNINWGYFACFIFGALLGCLNGILIGYYKLPSLIVTLGVSNLYWGIMLGPLNCTQHPLPANLAAFARKFLFTVTDAKSGLSSPLHVSAIHLVIMVFITWIIMQKTMLGRGIYAIGGNIDAASRLGFNVLAHTMFVYAFVGGLAGMIGYTRNILSNHLTPIFESGTELNIIAGVVLGGVRISGGVGTLTGALFGTVFITVLSNSLLLMGVNSYWAEFATGLTILIGFSITAIQIVFEKKRKLSATQADNREEEQDA